MEDLLKRLKDTYIGEDLLLINRQRILVEIEERGLELERAIAIQTPEREKKSLNNQIISLHLK